MEKLINIDEACDILRVSKKTIYRWRKNRGFPDPIIKGRKSLFDPAEVSRWLEYQKVLNEDDKANEASND